MKIPADGDQDAVGFQEAASNHIKRLSFWHGGGSWRGKLRRMMW